MKHIKLFESFESMYRAADKDEYLSMYSKLDSFSDWQISKLVSIFKKWDVRRGCKFALNEDNGTIKFTLGGKIFGNTF